MRPLPRITPSAEQLSIFSRNEPGIEIIRGAAGSGKTTTALLRLRSLISLFSNRRERLGISEPIRVLVLTYNRTLRGYINALAQDQVPEQSGVNIKISTFGKWAMEIFGYPNIVKKGLRKNFLSEKSHSIPLPEDYFFDEIEYLMGRYLPENLERYVTDRRDGRGTVPRVEHTLRRVILDDVVYPYKEWLAQKGLADWNDLAVRLSNDIYTEPYDIIVADETQDFSANQIRAIKNHATEVHSVTFVIDTAQRIYARGFTWKESGLTIRPENIRQLKRNYRNTIEIAQFIRPIIEGVPLDDDATIPDFSRCDKHGEKPKVLVGRFSGQINFAVQYIKDNVNLETESVAFLHPLGGGWLDETRRVLNNNDLDFVEITRRSDWPEGEENIALSTIHSSKGLEFDHVIIIGLEARMLPHGDGEDDDRLLNVRRLLAMGFGRAKKSIILGYKADTASKLVDYLDGSTFERKNV